MDILNICEQIDFDLIKKRILQTSTVAWDQKITNTSLERWLNNFSGEALGDADAEKVLAAWLLMNFTYYTENEVKELCRIVYRNFVHTKLIEDKYKSLDLKIENKIKLILKHTIFVKLGNPSESGAKLLYDFRIANALPKEVFEEPVDWEKAISEQKIENIVMIDDVTLSGSQAIEYLNKLPKVPIYTYLLTFFSTPAALGNIQTKAPSIVPMSAVSLDSRTQLFSDESFVFSNNTCSALKPHILKLCTHYGEKIVNSELPEAEKYMKKWPLGFCDGQQMFGFYYNTPDNTLPIFWCNSQNWNAAFLRHPKIYNIEGVEISDEQYW